MCELVHVYVWYVCSDTSSTSLVPRPFDGRRKGLAGTHCMRMRKFMDNFAGYYRYSVVGRVRIVYTKKPKSVTCEAYRLGI